MSGGRPSLFESPDKPKWPDGEYPIEDIKDSIDRDFLNERELCDFIELNIVEFTNEVLNANYVSHKREFSMSGSSRAIRGDRRIDFLIFTDVGKIGVECKNPTFNAEIAYGVGQCLGYLVEFKRIGNQLERLVIVSTRMDHVTPLIINEFSLPIDFVVMDKKKHLRLKKCHQLNQK